MGCANLSECKSFLSKLHNLKIFLVILQQVSSHTEQLQKGVELSVIIQNSHTISYEATCYFLEISLDFQLLSGFSLFKKGVPITLIIIPSNFVLQPARDL